MFVQTKGFMHKALFPLLPLFPLFPSLPLFPFSPSLGRFCLSSLLLASIALGVGCAAQTPDTKVNHPAPTAGRPTALNESVSPLPPSEQILGRPFRVWRQPSPTLIVLGIHGFNDYSKAFAPLAEALKVIGATVYAYDQQGFGENADAGRWPGDAALLTDIRQTAAHLRRSYPEIPLVVVGESMGGALVLRATSETEGLAADAIVLIAPAVWGMQIMPWYQRWGLAFMNAVMPNMTFTGNGIQHLGIRPTDDPAVSRDLSRDPLFIKETRVASLYGISRLMDKALTHPIRFPVPTLVLYGLNDRIIPPAPTCAWLSRLSLHSEKIPGHVEFVVYSEGWHMLTRQTRAEEVKKDLRHWLQAFANAQAKEMKQSGQSATGPSAAMGLGSAREAVCARAGGITPSRRVD
ncbi:MAG: alpha/beta fold hydrolase [Burkholderiaceae bacterium]